MKAPIIIIKETFIAKDEYELNKNIQTIMDQYINKKVNDIIHMDCYVKGGVVK